MPMCWLSEQFDKFITTLPYNSLLSRDDTRSFYPLSSSEFQRKLCTIEYLTDFKNVKLDVKKILYRKFRISHNHLPPSYLRMYSLDPLAPPAPVIVSIGSQCEKAQLKFSVRSTPY